MTPCPRPRDERRQDVSIKLLKRILRWQLTLSHRIDGQMEPRLATHATTTPVETSTPPYSPGAICVAPNQRIIRFNNHYTIKTARRPISTFAVRGTPGPSPASRPARPDPGACRTCACRSPAPAPAWPCRG